MQRKIRVLIAKPGLDGHDRGAKVVAYALRDAGCEVIYSGLRQSPPTLAATAIQEGVDVIGLSILSGAHMSLTRKLLDELHERGAADVIVLLGGVIPPEDVPTLKEWGVTEVFTSGASVDQILEVINKAVITECVDQ
ncbi:MAG: cobalamin B12-binding domain-containing protein [Desulfarculaceae bacterium]|jgi:methylmalonyl-CoA mutase C-terminal domain/subunit